MVNSAFHISLLLASFDVVAVVQLPLKMVTGIQAKCFLGMRVGNVLRLGCIFSVFSTIQGKTIAKPVKANAPELYNCYNHHPCARPAHVAKSWPLFQVL